MKNKQAKEKHEEKMTAIQRQSVYVWLCLSSRRNSFTLCDIHYVSFTSVLIYV